MNRYQDDVAFVLDEAFSVDAAYTFFQGNIVFLRYKELGLDATVLQICYDAGCYFTIVDTFPEETVGGALAGSEDSVAIVDENFRSCGHFVG